ncbi:MAG TPA: aldolase/citrate lyase family protein [Anaerolineales bacterium]|nr:aldolase/citrate lyase family protein [Anaerolineales bacterium]
MQNLTKTKLSNHQPAYGVISPTAEPMLAEWAGLSGLDYYMLDGEHGLFNPAEAVNVVRACELTGITPLVRIGPRVPKLVLQYMDAGFLGVMMPGLDTLADVKMLVEAIKYPPAGKRGFGPVRPADYFLGKQTQTEYLTQANTHTMVIPQFESPALLPLLPQIAALEGVDAIMIGPRDLSLTMGYPDGPGHPEVQRVIDEAIRVIRGAGKTAGITAATRADAEKQVQRGANLILTSYSTLVFQATKAFLPEF